MNCLLAEGTRTVIGIKAKKFQGRFFVDKVPVLDMLGRGGRVIYTVVRNTSYKQLIAREVLGIMKSFINFVPNLNTTIYTRQK